MASFRQNFQICHCIHFRTLKCIGHALPMPPVAHNIRRCSHHVFECFDIICSYIHQCMGCQSFIYVLQNGIYLLSVTEYMCANTVTTILLLSRQNCGEIMTQNLNLFKTRTLLQQEEEDIKEFLKGAIREQTSDFFLEIFPTH